MDDINPDDLISQLKAIPADSNKISRAVQERPELEKEEIENFVIQNSAKLIQDSLELIDNMKEVVHHMPEAENMSALSELVKASTGAIDTLNKISLEFSFELVRKHLFSLSLFGSNRLRAHAFSPRYTRNHVHIFASAWIICKLF